MAAPPEVRSSTRGRDMGISLRITLEEAAAGCKKTISYDRLAPCDDCNGTGVAEGGHETTCTRCNGTGRVVEVQRTIFGQMQSQSTCPACGGVGKVVDKPCETCDGQGRAPERETVELEIPAGIHSGQTVRVEGKGEAGIRGDRSGDLVARVDIAAHERYERQGDDLFCQIEIDAFEAMLGTTVTIDGIMEGETVDIVVPAGCQYGQQVRAEGKGMPRMGTTARGSVIAVVDVHPRRPHRRRARRASASSHARARGAQRAEAERGPPSRGARQPRLPRQPRGARRHGARLQEAGCELASDSARPTPSSSTPAPSRARPRPRPASRCAMPRICPNIPWSWLRAA